MAIIKPFKGMRYTEKAGDIGTLACPPYDIISEEQRKAYLERNPCNVVRLELPKGEAPYQAAGDTLKSWLDEAILKCDMDVGIYIYEEAFLSKVETGVPMSLKGIVCRVKLEDFENNVVLPHEETLSKAKADRFSLMEATNCNFSQIYSLFPDETHSTRIRIDTITANTKPRYEFHDGLVTHRLWVVNDPVTIQAFCDDFIDRKLYIADGHHRYETALNYRNHCRKARMYNPGSEYVMMFLADMADEGLLVFPTHRLVRDIPDFDENKLLQSCKAYFEVEPLTDTANIEAILEAKLHENKKSFVYYSKTKLVLLTLKDENLMHEIIPDGSDDYRMLDVSVLHSLILEKLLGIDKENMANQKNLTYTRSKQEALESVTEGKSQCAFFINPTAVSEIGAVAAHGEKMPQKSTYFYPKVTTGLVMNYLAEE